MDISLVSASGWWRKKNGDLGVVIDNQSAYCAKYQMAETYVGTCKCSLIDRWFASMLCPKPQAVNMSFNVEDTFMIQTCWIVEVIALLYFL